MKFKTMAALTALTIAGVSCGDYGAAPNGGESTGVKSFEPIDESAAVFWVRTTAEINDRFEAIVEDFNNQYEGVPVRAEFAGGYGDIYKKTLAGIHAGTLPAMAVAYESMTAEYVQAGAVEPLGEFLRHPELGFDLASFEDIFPAMIETNKYPQFDGRMYSFPFAKSVLMMYVNKTVLAEAGHREIPRTWEDFLEQCRAVKAETGKAAVAIDVDCSTVSGLIFSMGGEIVADGQSMYDSAEAVRVFELYETLAEEDLAIRIQPGSYDDHVAFAQDEVAFFFRTSASRTGLGELLGWDETRWAIAPLPQADPEAPHTVLFGPNIVVFDTTPALETSAWEFIRYFTSPENTVQWALATGYLPLRKSAAADPAMQAFWEEWPGNRAAFDCLAYAKPEPNLVGWQEVRKKVEEAVLSVLTGGKTGEMAATDLKGQADAIFAGALRSPR
jgi:multiple sugar transport system substrate-binding protein